uniref:Interleukin family protein n=1 Tax=Salvator merianae TaxID=96440 RepID=A0A8D0BTR5_SALMN
MNSLPTFFLFSLLLSLKDVLSQPSEHSCKYFADTLPLQLRELRVTFNEIKDYFVRTILPFLLFSLFLKGYLGCQSVSEMIQFYLEDVFSNVTTGNTIQQSVGFLKNMLLELRQTIKRCHRYFICEKNNRTIKDIKETYKKMKQKGIYKAMGEFDIFVNYIEEYLITKMKN